MNSQIKQKIDLPIVKVNEERVIRDQQYYQNPILLYYNYTKIESPEKLKNSQIEFCKKNNLKGRIIVAEEGINGTLGGTQENIEKYILYMQSIPQFSGTHFKLSEGIENSFPKLSVKVRPELVTLKLGEEDIDPNETTGKYLQADELRTWFESGKEFYIIDMRNDYEHKVGYFKDSILPNLKNFRDLPEILPQLEHLRDKTVLTVCTGGVRCEKASGLLVKHGFKDVYQLYGGIQTYMQKYPDDNFKGKLYVFDGRVTWGINPNTEIVSNCEKCGVKSDNYIDCAYKHCSSTHRHFICCKNCLDKNGNGYCEEHGETQ